MSGNANFCEESGIDKFDGSFEQEQSGCTIFINETVQSIKKLEVAGLYLYLVCRPPSWKLNVKHLANYFGCNKDKIYAIIDSLIEMTLLTRKEIRNKGKFVRYHYRVHLRPLNGNSVQMNAPVLEKPDTVKPDTENPDAYKTKNIENKECNNRSHIDSATDVAQTRQDESFDNFWKIYPIKKNKVRSKKIWDKRKYVHIETLICTDVLNRIATEYQWQDKQFIPHPASYLGNELWHDEINSTPPKSKKSDGDSFSQFMQKHKNQGATYDQHGNIHDPLGR